MFPPFSKKFMILLSSVAVKRAFEEESRPGTEKIIGEGEIPDLDRNWSEELGAKEAFSPMTPIFFD